MSEARLVGGPAGCKTTQNGKGEKVTYANGISSQSWAEACSGGNDAAKSACRSVTILFRIGWAMLILMPFQILVNGSVLLQCTCTQSDVRQRRCKILAQILTMVVCTLAWSSFILILRLDPSQFPFSYVERQQLNPMDTDDMIAVIGGLETVALFAIATASILTDPHDSISSAKETCPA
jgi:hypothetical protein